MTILDTKFNEQEIELLHSYIRMGGGEIKIIYAVDENKLFYEEFIEGDKNIIRIKSPHRIIEIGGLYLLEEANHLGIWSMGDVNKEKGYVFWGEYGTLDNAIRSL